MRKGLNCRTAAIRNSSFYEFGFSEQLYTSADLHYTDGDYQAGSSREMEACKTARLVDVWSAISDRVLTDVT